MYEFLTPSVWLSLQLWSAGQLSSGKYTAGGAFELYGCCGTNICTGHVQVNEEYIYLGNIFRQQQQPKEKSNNNKKRQQIKIDAKNF